MAITSAWAHQPRGEDRPVATMHRRRQISRFCRHRGLRDREQTDASNDGPPRGDFRALAGLPAVPE